ncbi:MAG: phospholipase A [Desulfobacterales bacterium]|nr:phospholipase A [Desulfobacterales bacterium]
MKLKYGLLSLLVWVLFTAWAFAATPGIELALVGPQSSVQSGGEAVLSVFFHNLTPDEIISQDHGELRCVISSKGMEIPVTAGARDGISVLKLAGNGFVKRQYGFRVPKSFTGQFQLRLEGETANAVFFKVDGVAEGKAMTPGKQMSARVAEEYYYSLADKLTPYQPVYFLMGADPGPEKSAFQISFKFQLFNPEGHLGQKAPWIDGFYLGYTQKSLWDLDSDSAPFEDTSYMPELFYRFDEIDLDIPWVKVFGLQTGFIHESNGQGGLDSRSTNRYYVAPFMLFPLWDDNFLSLVPRTWVYVNNSEEDNPDLADYRGYFELGAGIGDPEGVILNTLFRPADKGNTLEMDLSFPLSMILGPSVNLYFHAQYFSGYAETLLNYKERNDIFRLGISIVR